VNRDQIKELLQQGENLNVEFKKAENCLPDNLFETVCAFLNTDGGYILLGVHDSGEVLGVNPNSIEQMSSNLANLSNNPQKLDLPYLLLYSNGAKPVFKETKQLFKLTLPLLSAKLQVTQQVTQQVSRLLNVVIGEMSRTELMAKLSLKDRVNFTEKYLEPALLLALLEMTQASSPNSPTQKYRLTELGRQTLENLTRYK
jgi:predicted HTH transcriptional regulator